MRFVQMARAISGIAVFFIVATPLHAQNFATAPNFACAPGSPAKDTSASTFLKKLLGSVQYAWSGPTGTPNAADKIDPLAPSTTAGVPPTPDLGTGNLVTSCASSA